MNTPVFTLDNNCIANKGVLQNMNKIAPLMWCFIVVVKSKQTIDKASITNFIANSDHVHTYVKGWYKQWSEGLNPLVTRNLWNYGHFSTLIHFVLSSTMYGLY